MAMDQKTPTQQEVARELLPDGIDEEPTVEDVAALAAEGEENEALQSVDDGVEEETPEGDEAPSEAEKPAETPAEEVVEEEEDPELDQTYLDEVNRMAGESLQYRQMLAAQQAAQAQPEQQPPVQAVPQQPTAAPAQPFPPQPAGMTRESYDQALQTPEGLSNLLQQHGQQVAQQTQQATLQAVNPLIQQAVEQGMQALRQEQEANSVFTTFLSANPDLQPIHQLVRLQAIELNQKNPEWNLRKVLGEAGKAARQIVKRGSKQQQVTKKPATEVPVGRAQAQVKKEKTWTDKEFDFLKQADVFKQG